MVQPFILVVEDDTRLVMVLEDVLNAEGYRVAVARNGEEAIEALSNGVPDLIVLDVEMPRMSGIEFLKWLKEHSKYIPVIIANLLVTISCRQALSAVGVARSWPLPRGAAPRR